MGIYYLSVFVLWADKLLEMGLDIGDKNWQNKTWQETRMAKTVWFNFIAIILDSQF